MKMEQREKTVIPPKNYKELMVRLLASPRHFLLRDQQKAKIISLKITEAVTEETWVGS